MGSGRPQLPFAAVLIPAAVAQRHRLDRSALGAPLLQLIVAALERVVVDVVGRTHQLLPAPPPPELPPPTDEPPELLDDDGGGSVGVASEYEWEWEWLQCAQCSSTWTSPPLCWVAAWRVVDKVVRRS